MGNLEELLQAAESSAKRLAKTAKENQHILVVSHLDADGITSASTLGKALSRKGGRWTIRIFTELLPQDISSIAESRPGFVIFSDIGGGLIPVIREILGDGWLMVDHHQLPVDMVDTRNVFNPWLYGFDGGTEVSSSGMAYLLAKSMDEENVDSAWLAVVGALADRQDSGRRRSLTSLNAKMADEGVSIDQIQVSTDLLLFGRSTRPVHEAIAASKSPHIPGLSGNADVCLTALTTAGIKLKEGERWRTTSDLDEDEKRKVVEAIIPYMGAREDGSSIVDDLIGTVYVNAQEDEYSSLRDARECGTLLNACGRTGNASVGISLCLGDRNQALDDALKILDMYRGSLSEYLITFTGNPQRVQDRGRLLLLIGDGVVEEGMLGSLTSLVSGTPAYSSKIVLARTQTRRGDVKFSARRGATAPEANLGRILAAAATECRGFGGGHAAAAGATVPASRSQDLAEKVFKEVMAVP